MKDPIKDLVIGLDIGTTSTIGLLMRPPGAVLFSTSRPVDLVSRFPGWAEEDPEQWWQNSVSILSELAQVAGPDRLAGICVTGMLPALVLLGTDDQVLRRSIQQSDGRVGAQVAELAAELDEAAFLARTGNGINQQLVAAKLRWLALHEPDVFAGIDTVFGSYDFINWRLTGQKTIEQNWALEAGFTDLASGQIADDLVALAGIPPTVLPPRIRSHDINGRVSAQASAVTGLPEGLPVFGGAADHIVSALAAGITQAGDVLLKFGGAGDIVVAAKTPQPDARLFMDYHLVPGLYAPNGCMAASGSALNWMADLLGTAGDGALPHKVLDDLASAVPAGSEGVRCIPYFLGEKTPIHDPRARGVFMGLTLDQGQGHVWRAMLEGIAFAFRHHLDVLSELGTDASRIRASDGGSASAVWMQIVADVLGEPVQVLANHYGSSLGAAFVAAIGTGLETDWAAAGRLAELGTVFTPNPGNRAVYDAAYSEFHQIYHALKPILHARD
jgi:xylulokinase